ncbi:hypothetical protein OIU77_011585 [Salix suchowensis]|uniref:Uncharacterized protein n=1 Tax=Salix suchowensis TaxID=1278906 RepID=A0ABQ9A0S4_9ROSI|nr:hypothetical protein OIU77_011585 [Salix suchowensis]
MSSLRTLSKESYFICGVDGVVNPNERGKNDSEELINPATGPLFSPFSDGPNRDFDAAKNTHTNHTNHHPVFHDHKQSFPHVLQHLNLTPSLGRSSSSPMSELDQEKGSSRIKGLRKSFIR